MMFSRVKYADIGSRILAWMVDCAIIFFLSVVLMSFLDALFVISINDMDTMIFTIVLLITFWGVGILYGTLAGYLSKGHTMGKLLWGIATVEDDLKYATPKAIFIDNVLKYSPLVIVDVIVGMIKYPSDPQLRIRLFQGLSKTVVVRIR